MKYWASPEATDGGMSTTRVLPVKPGRHGGTVSAPIGEAGPDSTDTGSVSSTFTGAIAEPAAR
ncbi:hypothetical protein ACIQWL_43940 [Streptomyces mirabilis]|uniref:hypothetical protein n=1 Tax=Streptomyces mirabilis TaxID=68239 RepID=UPI0007659CBE